ncbi:glutamate--tRNA ligase [Candidatus Woesearchaeota archaeon]|nr:glutamate--tRNA ligase [Candidatus Woesearchaeota archaeon]
MEDKIREYALENAVKFKGKAAAGVIIGKLMAHDQTIKQRMQELSPIINKIVNEVNSMSLEEQTKLLHDINPDFDKQQEDKKKENKEKSQSLKELKNVTEGVVMRFAPSPSGPMHLGHAMTGGLTCLYAKKYNGKFILRVEDTNSDNIYPPAYEQIPEDAAWIFGNVNEVWIQSDRMQIYYDYAQKFFEKDSLYVCTCDREVFKELITESKPCPCRSLPKEEQLARWQKMFDKENGFKEGEAVVRFKSDIEDKNPAMRDFPLFRINDSEHPRQGLKYRVWPLMNMSVTVDDIEAGMTQIIRAKDHMDNAKRQKMMYDVLGVKYPETYFTGRYNFTGLELSCSKTKVKIADGEFSGWDDIRLPFLRALKRRGYRPGSFLKYTELVGLTSIDKSVDAKDFFQALDSYNKDIIDPIAKRFFMIKNPMPITIEDAPEISEELDLHPDNLKGGRSFSTAQKFLIEKEDFEHAKSSGKVCRLIDWLNFSVNDQVKFEGRSYEEFRGHGDIIIHWLPADDSLIDIEVLMPDNTLIKAKAERNLNLIKVDEVIQFQRFGFCRLDEIKSDGTRVFWFTHE